MLFDYGIYYASAVKALIPMILMGYIAFSALVGIIVYTCRNNIEYIIRCIVVILVPVLVLTANELNNHLLWLFLEGEECATVRTGFVEYIVDESSSRANFTDDERCYVGTYLTIDGIKYLAIHSNGLELGKEVQIRCLPKSRIILQWETVENACSPLNHSQ